MTKKSGAELNETFPVGSICVVDESVKIFSDSGKVGNVGDRLGRELGR